MPSLARTSKRRELSRSTLTTNTEDRYLKKRVLCTTNGTRDRRDLVVSKVKGQSKERFLSSFTCSGQRKIFYFRNEETGRRTHAEHFLVRKKSCEVKRARMVRKTTSDGRLLDVCMPPRDADRNYLLYMVRPLTMCILENYTMLGNVCIERG